LPEIFGALRKNGGRKGADLKERMNAARRIKTGAKEKIAFEIERETEKEPNSVPRRVFRS